MPSREERRGRAADAEDEDTAAAAASGEEVRRATAAGPAAGRPTTAERKVEVAGEAAGAGRASVTKTPRPPPWGRTGRGRARPERRRRKPRPPPPLDPNLAPAANYLKSRFGSNPFPYPDRGDASIYFPASSGKLVSRRAVNARHFNEMPWFAWHEVI